MAGSDPVATLSDAVLKLVHAARADAGIGIPQTLEALARAAARVGGELFDQADAEQRRTHAKVLGALFAQTAENMWTAESQIWPDPNAPRH